MQTLKLVSRSRAAGHRSSLQNVPGDSPGTGGFTEGRQDRKGLACRPDFYRRGETGLIGPLQAGSLCYIGLRRVARCLTGHRQDAYDTLGAVVASWWVRGQPGSLIAPSLCDL
jgi:hypothetical protein